MDVVANTGDTNNALAQMSAEMDNAIKFATTQVGQVAASQMQSLIVGRHKPGTPTPSMPGEPPSNITGNLRRSIRSTVTGFGGIYTATVGPYMVYARALEFGHPDWESGVKYPFVAPTATIMQANDRAKNIFVNAVRYALYRSR